MSADISTEDRRSIVVSEVMSPEKANFAGNIHGGHLLLLLDRVAYACAAQYAGSYVVTVSVDQVIFKEPIHVCELVTCYASVNYVGRSSMEIGIKVVSENLIKRMRRHTNSCFFTMVAVNEQLKPVVSPVFEPGTPTEKRRWTEACARRAARLALRQQHLGNKSA